MSGSRRGRGQGRQALRSVAVLCLLVAQEPAVVDVPLYAPGGIRPEGVRQGYLGSCYFHATVAALAQSNPQLIQRIIEENPDGSYTVRFADGKKEKAYPEDIRYARREGYEQSDGLWVAVLFRAFAQQVLRESLLKAVDKSTLFPLLKGPVKGFIASHDSLLMAYDRAIRAAVDAQGTIDRARLKAKLKEQMKPLALPADIEDSLVGLLESKGSLDTLAAMINENGELFGAYRAVGHGGLPGRVFQALLGSADALQVESEAQAAGFLERAFRAGVPVVAATSRAPSTPAGLLPLDADTWYVPLHGYTVLGFDPAGRSVTLRNPWGRQPEPEGVFTLPVTTFVQTFRWITTGVP